MPAVPSPLTEDDVKIVVVVRPNEKLSAEELWRYCDENMPRFWVPRYIEFRDVLPRTPTQKVEKYIMRQQGITEDTWDRVKAGVEIKRQKIG